MKVHILPGFLANYHRNGGSWNAAKPDPEAIVTELPAVPQQGQFIVFEDPKNDHKEKIARVDDVVLTAGANVFIFVTM